MKNYQQHEQYIASSTHLQKNRHWVLRIGAAKAGSTKGGVANAEVATAEVVKVEVAKAEVATAEVVKVEVAKAEVTKAGVAKADLGRRRGEADRKKSHWDNCSCAWSSHDLGTAPRELPCL